MQWLNIRPNKASRSGDIHLLMLSLTRVLSLQREVEGMRMCDGLMLGPNVKL